MINAHQGNPFVDIESGEIGSVANFDATRLFNVLTYLQTALGNLLSSLVRRGERKVVFLFMDMYVFSQKIFQNYCIV